MNLNIKNLINPNDFIIVRIVIEMAGYTITQIEKGYVIIAEVLNSVQWQQLNEKLEKTNHGLYFDRDNTFTEKTKIVICDNLFSAQAQPRDYLRKKIKEVCPHVSYERHAGIFSKTEGVPLQKYIIGKKVERLEILIMEGELSIPEIATGLGYNKVSYMKEQDLLYRGKSIADFMAELTGK